MDLQVRIEGWGIGEEESAGSRSEVQYGVYISGSVMRYEYIQCGCGY